MVYAICIAANGGPEVCLVVFGQIAGNIVKPKHYVTQRVGFVWHHDADNSASVIGDTYLHSVLVGQNVKCGRVGFEICGVKP